MARTWLPALLLAWHGGALVLQGPERAGQGYDQAPEPEGDCRTAVTGEVCHKEVTWAMTKGIVEHKFWYPGLHKDDVFEAFQDFLHKRVPGVCPKACQAGLPQQRLAGCHTAVEGEGCHNEVVWAMEKGIHENPSWYPGLTSNSSFEDFQMHLHSAKRLRNTCAMPCNAEGRSFTLDPTMRKTAEQVADESSLPRRAMDSFGTVLERMQYWRRSTSALPSTGKYLLFTPDAGGLNNIRIGWEMTGLVARHTGRTLVLPPKTPMYLLDNGPWNQALVGDTSNWTGSTMVEDLIDVTQLKGVLPTLTMEEFEHLEGMSWNEARLQAGSLADSKYPDWTGRVRLSDYEALADRFVFMNGSLRDGEVLGQWWSRGGPRDELRPEVTEADWALLRHGFVWHPDAFSIAAKAVRYLGMFDYVAFHARFGDFVEKKSQRSPDEIYENWKPLITNASALYVATDRQEQFDGFAKRNGVKLVMWPDLFTAATGRVLAGEKQLYTPERFFKLTGLVEELICTYAQVFVGTDRSSFTGHIQRMRIHADAPVTQRLTHTDGDPTPEAQRSHSTREVRVPLEEIQQTIQDWEKRDWLVPAINQGDQFRQSTISLRQETRLS